MSVTLKRYMELKERVEQAQQKAAKAEGALEQEMKRIKTGFGCTTLEQGEKKLRQLKRQEEQLDAEFEKAMEEFEEKWNEE